MARNPSLAARLADDPVARARAVLGLATDEAPIELPVGGSSMEPLLRAGDRVLTVPARRVAPGDVVVLGTESGHLLVHRVLGPLLTFHGWRWVTRGDAAPTADGTVPRSRILGRALTVLAPGGEPRASLRPTVRRRLACLLGLAAYSLRRLRA